MKIFPAQVPSISSSSSVTEYFAQTRWTPTRWRQQESNVRRDSICRHLISCTFPMSIPEPFEGFESLLVEFFFQCKLYFSSLVDPKSKEKQWLGFMLFQFTGTTRQWAELLVTTGIPNLRNVAELVYIMKLCFKADPQLDVDSFLERATMTAETTRPFTSYYKKFTTYYESDQVNQVAVEVI